MEPTLSPVAPLSLYVRTTLLSQRSGLSSTSGAVSGSGSGSGSGRDTSADFAMMNRKKLN